MWESSQSDEDIQMSVRILLAYDRIFDMNEAMSGTFHTYAYFDKEISTVDGSDFEIVRPDLLEKKLADLKILLRYLDPPTTG